MKYNFYTKHSPKVSEIGLGTWQLGNAEEWSEMTDKRAVSLVHRALDEGINFFDTAPNYAGGNSERLIGKALKGRDRTKLVISTKFGHWPDGHTDFDADKIRESVEGSLRRLDTDYLDSVLLHNPGREIVIGDSQKHYEILEELKSEGKILVYGASLDTAEEMTEFINNKKGEVIEAFFNLIHQDARNAFKLANDNEIGIIAKIPLDSGWLTGKYNEDSVFTGIRKRWSAEDIKRRAKIVDFIRKMMPAEGSMAQKAIGYCLYYDSVSTVIPGCINEKQLLENVKSTGFKPDALLIAKLEEFYDKEIKRLSLPW
jgi:aryl-alcohol dehydrogenase-like predicted oxidoreductase